MAQNRLHLDFSISGTSDRKDFVDQYVQRPEFISKPLNEDELETIANYILWGKDDDGLNCTQRGEIQIETRNKTWQRDDTESLDAMMESPTFNEASLRRPTEARTRIAREVFDRQKALRDCPDYMRSTFEDLFARIDKLEAAIQIYEWNHGRRKKEPNFPPLREEELAQAHSIAAKWNQFQYLKQRHLIVELRREQFTLRDNYIERHLRHTPPEPDLDPVCLDLENEVPVYPIGMTGGRIGELAFKEVALLNPQTHTEKDLKELISFFWKKKQEARPQYFFDFEDETHVFRLIERLEELEDDLKTSSVESNLKGLIDTLEYYVKMAALDDIQTDIMMMKIQKKSNNDIAVFVNEKYGKGYAVNYISTIFRKKIVPKICATASYHALILENLPFKENFKKCNTCGEMLLLDSENFIKRTRSKDGFSNRCKKCDRADRIRQKGEV